MYVVFLATIAAVPAMATDMYLPAMPTIAAQWGVASSQVALSLVLWFATFSVFLLICGPLSDKYGRRPVLLAGLTLFTGATAACMLATNVAQLIVFRIFQGIGASGPSSMCMAICRDRYDGSRRKHVLAWIGIILALAPMLSPSIGAMLLKVSTWRAIFAVQTVLGAVVLLTSWRLYRETAAQRVSGRILALMGRYARLVNNRRYLLSVTAMGLIVGPFFGFIAFAPVVYIQIYGLSSQAFGILFGLNALMGMLGAYVCTRLTRFLSDATLLTACLIGCAAGGAGILLWGGWHYAAFAACMCVITFSGGMSRPLSNNLILEQVSQDIGSASAFLVFYQFMVGAICMRIATTSWSAPLFVFGLMALLVPAVVLAIWPWLLTMLRKPGASIVKLPTATFDTPRAKMV
ncbi:MAG: multidrug effflux MFS transporter [Sedimentisphaerales bacterium]|nr:multidrug effflux MFS transporter [Sedimentisphaerales bacterium]